MAHYVHVRVVLRNCRAETGNTTIVLSIDYVALLYDCCSRSQSTSSGSANQPASNQCNATLTRHYTVKGRGKKKKNPCRYGLGPA